MGWTGVGTLLRALRLWLLVGVGLGINSQDGPTLLPYVFHACGVLTGNFGRTTRIGSRVRSFLEAGGV